MFRSIPARAEGSSALFDERVAVGCPVEGPWGGHGARRHAGVIGAPAQSDPFSVASGIASSVGEFEDRVPEAFGVDAFAVDMDSCSDEDLGGSVVEDVEAKGWVAAWVDHDQVGVAAEEGERVAGSQDGARCGRSKRWRRAAQADQVPYVGEQ